jgi:CBS domain-containing protein
VTTIRQVMSTRFAVIQSHDSVAKAIGILSREQASSLPVVDDRGALVGMITDLELIDVVFDREIKNRPVSMFVRRSVHSIDPDESLARAAQLFALYSFWKVPVVESGKFVGLVTCRDLMNYALESGEVLAEPLLELIPSLAPLS